MIRLAAERDLPFLVHLQRRESDALEFIALAGLRDRVDRRRVYLAEENGEPAAFCLFDVHGAGAVIHQTAAIHDTRRRGLALALAQRVRAEAGRRGASFVRLACASDLPEALAFWRAAGFAAAGLRPGGRARRRDLHLFRAPTLAPVQREFAFVERIDPGAHLGASAPPLIEPPASAAVRFTAAQRQRSRTHLSGASDWPLFDPACAAWDACRVTILTPPAAPAAVPVSIDHVPCSSNNSFIGEDRAVL